MRGAFSVVNETLVKANINVNNIIDIGLALGMQIPWTRETAKEYGADLYSVDINLKNFFDRSICKYLPPKDMTWDDYPKTSDRADWGYDPDVQDPLTWIDLENIEADIPTYSYGDDSHLLVHGHSTKFLRAFPGDIDVMLLDGDHRYISVWNDLNVFKSKNGKIAFFDDIDTIFARTEVSMDRYVKNPDFELVDGEHSWVVKGPGGTYYSEILDGATGKESVIGIDEFENTKSVPGKCGVLTAIEDFVKSNPEYEFDIYKTGAGGMSIVTNDFKQCGVLRLRSLGI